MRPVERLQRDRPEQLSALLRERRMRRDDVEVERAEVREAVGMQPGRDRPLGGAVVDEVDRVERLDVDVCVVRQLVGQGLARPRELRQEVDGDDAVHTQQQVEPAKQGLPIVERVLPRGRDADRQAVTGGQGRRSLGVVQVRGGIADERVRRRGRWIG